MATATRSSTFVARGLDVEGLDASPDMLARCRANAAARGLVVTLHESTMEAMELPRRYRSIYLAGPSFNLLTDDDMAWRALARIRAHLEPDGSALIPLFVPEPVPAEVARRAAHAHHRRRHDAAVHGPGGGPGRRGPVADDPHPVRARARR